MSTTRVRIEPGDPATLPAGRIDAARVDSTTEADIDLQEREDDAEATQDAARYARRVRQGAAECSGATMDDLDSEAMFRFIRTARRSRQFPLPEETPPSDLLRHLNLLMLFADRLEVMNSGRLPPALTVEKLRVAHQSLPGNPLLAEAMYLLRYSEKMGTGIGDMIRRCAEAGLPEPEFDVDSGFTLRIWRQGATTRKRASTTQKTKPTTQETATTTQETGPTTQETARKTAPTTQKAVRDQILDHLRAKPELTRKALAERVGLTPDGVKYHLAALKEAGALRRVGSTKAGRWEVL